MLSLCVLGDIIKILVSPLLKSSCKAGIMSSFTPKSLKRSYSASESESSDRNFTPKRKCERSEDENDRWTPRHKSSFHSRRSLPSQSKRDSFSTPDNSYKRRSFPLRSSPYQSPSTYRSCAADQTPYAAKNSDGGQNRFRTILPCYNASELVSLKSESGFIDSHCHLDFLFQRQGYAGTYKDYQRRHEDTFPASYRGCLAVFCNPITFSQQNMWEKYLEEENVWASFGCHPHNAKDYNDDVEKSLCAVLKHPKVRALGEIGLDYSSRNYCMKEKQFDAFRRQLKLALKEKLPVVIHCREAHEDGMKIVKEILPNDYTIHLHCFTDTWELAEQWLDKFPNLFIGITNVVTFPSAENVHEVARNIPLSRLLLETDAPYFVPRTMPKGTKFSHPGLAIHVAAQIATLKDVPLEQVLQSTRENTRRMYNI